MNARLRVALLAGFVLLVGVLGVSAAHAQEVRPGAPPPMRFEAYGQQQGFQGNHPWDLLPDRYGFVWVTSQKGVARFDGIQFEHVDFNIEDWHTDSFPVQLAESEDGDIWIGTYAGGLVHLDRQTGAMRDVARPSDANGEMPRRIREVVVLKDGRIVRFTSKDDIFEGVTCFDIFDPATGTLTPVRTGVQRDRIPGFDCDALITHSTTTRPEGGPWLQDRRGRLWLGAEGGLFHLEPGADSLVGPRTSYHEPYPAAGLARLDLLVDGTPPLAALTRVGKGADLERVFDLEEATDVLLLGVGELVPLQAWDVGWLENARGDTLWAMDVLRSAWAGGRTRNRLVVDTLTLAAGRYRLRYRSDQAWNFGDWWYTWEGLGGDRSDAAPSRPAWWGLQVFPVSGSTSLPAVTAGPAPTVHGVPRLPSAFLETRDGAVWIGTGRGELVRYDQQADRYDPFPLGVSDPFGLLGARVRSLAEDEAGDVWVGVDGHGLIRLDPRSGRTRRYAFLDTLDETAWTDVHVIYRVLSDPDGTIWAGTGSGLVHLDPRTGGFNIYGRSLEANVPPALHVSTLLRDPGGALWFTSDARSPLALFRLSGAADAVRALTHVEGEARTLPPRRATGIVEADDGTVWVGSDRGLMQYDTEAGTLFEPDLGMNAAKLDRAVTPLLAEAGGDLWLIDRVRRALHRYHPATGTLATFQTPGDPGACARPPQGGRCLLVRYLPRWIVPVRPRCRRGFR